MYKTYIRINFVSFKLSRKQWHQNSNLPGKPILLVCLSVIFVSKLPEIVLAGCLLTAFSVVVVACTSLGFTKCSNEWNYHIDGTFWHFLNSKHYSVVFGVFVFFFSLHEPCKYFLFDISLPLFGCTIYKQSQTNLVYNWCSLMRNSKCYFVFRFLFLYLYLVWCDNYVSSTLISVL